MNLVVVCAGPADGIPAGKSKWVFRLEEVNVNGGWVLLGCNCPGKCCPSPPAAGADGQEVFVDCIDCPPPRSGGPGKDLAEVP